MASPKNEMVFIIGVVLDYENSTAFLNSPVFGSLVALKAAAKPKSKYATNPEQSDVLGVGT